MENQIPKHIAVVMDGNRRWARENKLPVYAGHRYVADKVLEPLVEHAAGLGIKYMTFWAWSTENWRRSENEVKTIMRLFRQVLSRNMDRLHEQGVRIKIIGDTGQFSADIRRLLREVEAKTEKNTKITTVFGLNYGGRNEIVRAFNRIPEGKKSEISENDLTDNLDTKDIPDPDVIVRPGGEKRLSGFMLWQCEYSELLFYDWKMPEFTPQKLDEVIADYTCRKRRFGC